METTLSDRLNFNTCPTTGYRLLSKKDKESFNLIRAISLLAISYGFISPVQFEWYHFLFGANFIFFGVWCFILLLTVGENKRRLRNCLCRAHHDTALTILAYSVFTGVVFVVNNVPFSQEVRMSVVALFLLNEIIKSKAITVLSGVIIYAYWYLM